MQPSRERTCRPPRLASIRRGGVAGVAVVLSVALLSSGCATAVYGPLQRTAVNSVPQGATASSESTKASCTTPCKLLVHKKEESITLTKAGYGDQMVPLEHETHYFVFFFGNLVPSAGLGMIMDAISGAMYEVQPVDAQLSRAE